MSARSARLYENTTMNAPTLDELANLSEEEAVQRHFDGINYQVFRRILLMSACFGFAFVAVLSRREAAFGRFPFAVLFVLVDAAYFLARRNRRFEQHFRGLLLAFLALQFLLGSAMLNRGDMIAALAIFFFPPVLLLVRLRDREFTLIGVLCVATAFAHRLFFHEGTLLETFFLGFVLPGVANAGWIALAIFLTRGERRRFVAQWSVVSARESDRRRMRDELEVARGIQLSMLPDCCPVNAGIDVAGASLPATEVGGDFYDYYTTRDEGLAMVIGDVAGHGLASGIVLAAMKSGLYLVRESLDEPAKALAELNGMVRNSIRRRMLVSILVATVDRKRGGVRVITAGHPPMLHLSARDGSVSQVGTGALPLGTNLPVTYPVTERAVAAGDVLLLVTDGVTESLRGEEMFGDMRIVDVLKRNAAGSAEQIRDAVLREAVAFRRDAPQEDDMTVVVAKIR